MFSSVKSRRPKVSSSKKSSNIDCLMLYPQSITRRQYGMFVYLLVLIGLLALLIFQVYNCFFTYQLINPFLLESIPSQSLMLYDSLSKNVLEKSLVADGPFAVVHYLWCRKGHFEFKHFISILSIYKTIRPDKIVFHYWELPVKDKTGFVTWFDDIQRDIHNLVLKKISDRRFCGHRFFESSDFHLGDFHSPSGIFVSDDIAVSGFTRELFYSYLTNDTRVSRSSNKVESTCSNIWGRVFLLPASEPAVVSESSKSFVIRCPTIHDYNLASSNNKVKCVQITNRVFPSDIWRPTDRFSSLARSVVYGSEDPIVPISSDSDHVPRHAHILHFKKKGVIGHTAYASILSSLYVAGLKHVFLHGDEEPTGPVWEDLQQHNVTFVPVQFLDEWKSEHADLLYGMYILMHYGGVLTRSNTVWRNPIPSFLLSFNTVVTVRRSIYRIVNPSIDLNVLIAQKHSPYIETLLAELRQTPVKHKSYKIEDIAYRIYQSVPASVDLETNLIQHAKCKEIVCQATAGDLGASGAYAVHMIWDEDQEPSTRDQVEHLRGPGADVVKKMFHLVKGL